MAAPQGFDIGLTNYGDRDFARFLRRSFARSTGLSAASLAKPIVGIAATPSDFNNCHRTMDELVAAVVRGVTAARSSGEVFGSVRGPYISPEPMGQHQMFTW